MFVVVVSGIGDVEDEEEKKEEEGKVIGDVVYCVDLIQSGIQLLEKVKLIVFKCQVFVFVD